jgi:hypothetical protein
MRRSPSALTTFCRASPLPAAIASYRDASGRVELIASGKAGAWAAAALAQADGAVARAAIDTGGFRFTQLRSIHDVDFLPGGAKYFDLPGMIALTAPTELWLADAGSQPPDVARAAYEAAGAAGKFETVDAALPEKTDAAVSWLNRP